MKDRINHVTAGNSLSLVKGKIQLLYSKQQALEIIEHFDSIDKATTKDAPVRRQGQDYRLNRKTAVRQLNATARQSLNEKFWEHACYCQWHSRESRDVGFDKRISFSRVVSYQVMLRESNRNKKWGQIDLLGASPEGLPVTIEVKSTPSEKLLRAIVEVLANGIAIRKAWSQADSVLRKNWNNETDGTLKESDLSRCELVIAAPKHYWDVVLPSAGRRVAHRTPFEALGPIAKLIRRINNNGFRLQMVEIVSNGERDGIGLPVVSGARIVDFPTAPK